MGMEFKDGIPIMYQLFCANFADYEKLHIFATQIVSRGRTM